MRLLRADQFKSGIFGLVAACLLAPYAGCDSPSRAGLSKDNRAEAIELALSRELKESKTKADEKEFENQFITRLENINFETTDKKLVYQELATLCQDVGDYNQMCMRRGRYNVLPDFLTGLESIAIEQFPHFQINYDLLARTSKWVVSEPTDVNASLKVAQLTNGVKLACKRELAKLDSE